MNCRHVTRLLLFSVSVLLSTGGGSAFGQSVATSDSLLGWYQFDHDKTDEFVRFRRFSFFAGNLENYLVLTCQTDAATMELIPPTTYRRDWAEKFTDVLEDRELVLQRSDGSTLHTFAARVDNIAAFADFSFHDQLYSTLEEISTRGFSFALKGTEFHFGFGLISQDKQTEIDSHFGDRLPTRHDWKIVFESCT